VPVSVCRAFGDLHSHWRRTPQSGPRQLAASSLLRSQSPAGRKTLARRFDVVDRRPWCVKPACATPRPAPPRPPEREGDRARRLGQTRPDVASAHDKANSVIASQRSTEHSTSQIPIIPATIPSDRSSEQDGLGAGECTFG